MRAVPAILMLLCASTAIAGVQSGGQPVEPTTTQPSPPGPSASPIPESPAAPAAPRIVLEPGKAVEIACETKSVVVAEGAPNATKGSLTLKLELAAPGSSPQGRWTTSLVDATHTGAFAAAQRKTCEGGCPLTVAPNGDIQLWAPAAKTLDTLKEGEILLLAVVRADQALRASTFKGQAIEALEEGHCKKVMP